MVALALEQGDEAFARPGVVGRALQDLVVSELGALGVRDVPVVEIAELEVDVGLPRRIGDEAREADQRLLGAAPVLLGRRDLGERCERLDVIGVRLEGGGEGALGRGRVADVGERSTAEHLHLDPLARIGDRVEATLEEPRELAARAGGDVDRLEPLEHVLVRRVDLGDLLERVSGTAGVVHLVLPEERGAIEVVGALVRPRAGGRSGLEARRGAGRVARLLERARELEVRDEVVRDQLDRVRQERERVVGHPGLGGALGGAERERRGLARPLGALDELAIDLERELVIVAGPGVRLHLPERPESSGACGGSRPPPPRACRPSSWP